MNNYIIARNFIENPQGYYKKNYLSVGYSDGVFYSYSTAIAEVVKDVEGNDILLVSDDKFSITTGRHIKHILCANKKSMKVFFIAQELGCHAFYAWNVYHRIERELNALKKSNLKRQANRELLIHYYEMLQEVLKLKKFGEYIDWINDVLNEFKDLYNNCVAMEERRIAKYRERNKQ